MSHFTGDNIHANNAMNGINNGFSYINNGHLHLHFNFNYHLHIHHNPATNDELNEKIGSKRKHSNGDFKLSINEDPPRKKQKIQTIVNTNNKNDTNTNDIIDKKTRDELIDTLMPQLNVKKHYWITCLKNKRVQIIAHKKHIPTKQNKKKKENKLHKPEKPKKQKVILDCHILCKREYDCDKVKEYHCLCGKKFMVTPPKINSKTGKKMYTNRAVSHLNQHMLWHIRSYFDLTPNPNELNCKIK